VRSEALKKDFIAPILVLSIICLVISGALALTNSITEPVIAAAAAEREEAAMHEIIPDADIFELMDIDGLPATVREVYRSANGAGHIFIITTSGYGGDLRIICGIGPDGKLLHCKALEQSETKGLGARITEPAFEKQFDGVDSRLDGVAAISGATISSTAYINAIKDAFTAYEAVKGGAK
jgi:electron transport complex protein RnfG